MAQHQLQENFQATRLNFLLLQLSNFCVSLWTKDIYIILFVVVLDVILTWSVSLAFLIVCSLLCFP